MSGERPLCLFGAGGHGRVVASQIQRFQNRRFVFGDAQGTSLSADITFSDPGQVTGHEMVVTIGDNKIREKIQLGAPQVAPAIVIEPNRVFSEIIGYGSQVLCGAVINSGAEMGHGVIVNTAAIVEHDVVVGDFTHIAPGAVLGGSAVIGARVLIGSNATVMPGVRIAPDVTVGAGAVVTKDITESGVWVGSPARFLRALN